jgi:integrase
VADITPEHIQKFLEGRSKVSAVTLNNDKIAVSRFFSWCIDRPRKWLRFNPCREVKVEQADKPAPLILSVDRCQDLLRAAEGFKAGRLVRYTALCLFGKLRPFEARRLKPEQINLADGEIRLEKWQTKTRRPRVITICPTLKAWLQAYPGEVFPSNWRKDFDSVKELSGFAGRQACEENKKLEPWVEDILRHTGISHYFRKTGSYGLTAEESGNSEAIIKAHYQGRVTSEDTKRFYGILPKRRRQRKSRSRKIINMPASGATEKHDIHIVHTATAPARTKVAGAKSEAPASRRVGDELAAVNDMVGAHPSGLRN